LNKKSEENFHSKSLWTEFCSYIASEEHEEFSLLGNNLKNAITWSTVSLKKCQECTSHTFLSKSKNKINLLANKFVKLSKKYWCFISFKDIPLYCRSHQYVEGPFHLSDFHLEAFSLEDDFKASPLAADVCSMDSKVFSPETVAVKFVQRMLHGNVDENENGEFDEI